MGAGIEQNQAATTKGINDVAKDISINGNTITFTSKLPIKTFDVRYQGRDSQGTFSSLDKQNDDNKLLEKVYQDGSVGRVVSQNNDGRYFTQIKHLGDGNVSISVSVNSNLNKALLDIGNETLALEIRDGKILQPRLPKEEKPKTDDKVLNNNTTSSEQAISGESETTSSEGRIEITDANNSNAAKGNAATLNEPAPNVAEGNPPLSQTNSSTTAVESAATMHQEVAPNTAIPKAATSPNNFQTLSEINEAVVLPKYEGPKFNHLYGMQNIRPALPLELQEKIKPFQESITELKNNLPQTEEGLKNTLDKLSKEGAKLEKIVNKEIRALEAKLAEAGPGTQEFNEISNKIKSLREIENGHVLTRKNIAESLANSSDEGMSLAGKKELIDLNSKVKRAFDFKIENAVDKQVKVILEQQKTEFADQVNKHIDEVGGKFDKFKRYVGQVAEKYPLLNKAGAAIEKINQFNTGLKDAYRNRQQAKAFKTASEFSGMSDAELEKFTVKKLASLEENLATKEVELTKKLLSGDASVAKELQEFKLARAEVNMRLKDRLEAEIAKTENPKIKLKLEKQLYGEYGEKIQQTLEQSQPKDPGTSTNPEADAKLKADYDKFKAEREQYVSKNKEEAELRKTKGQERIARSKIQELDSEIASNNKQIESNKSLTSSYDKTLSEQSRNNALTQEINDLEQRNVELKVDREIEYAKRYRSINDIEESTLWNNKTIAQQNQQIFELQADIDDPDTGIRDKNIAVARMEISKKLLRVVELDNQYLAGEKNLAEIKVKLEETKNTLGKLRDELTASTSESNSQAIQKQITTLGDDLKNLESASVAQRGMLDKQELEIKQLQKEVQKENKYIKFEKFGVEGRQISSKITKLDDEIRVNSEKIEANKNALSADQSQTSEPEGYSKAKTELADLEKKNDILKSQKEYEISKRDRIIAENELKELERNGASNSELNAKRNSIKDLIEVEKEKLAVRFDKEIGEYDQVKDKGTPKEVEERKIRNELDKLESKQDNLEKAQNRNYKANLKDQVAASNNEVIQEIESKNAQIREINESIKKYSIDLKSLEENISDNAKQIEEVKSNLETKKASLNNAASEQKAVLEGEIKDLEKALKSQEKLAEALNTKKEFLVAKNDLSSELSKLEKLNKDLSLAKTPEETAALKNQVNEVNTKISELSTKVQEMSEGMKNSIKVELDDLNARLKQIEDALPNAKDGPTKQALERQAEKLKPRMEELKANLNEMSPENISKLNAELGNLNAQINQNKLAIIEKNISDNNRILEEAKKKIVDKQSVINDEKATTEAKNTAKAGIKELNKIVKHHETVGEYLEGQKTVATAQKNLIVQNTKLQNLQNTLSTTTDPNVRQELLRQIDELRPEVVKLAVEAEKVVNAFKGSWLNRLKEQAAIFKRETFPKMMKDHPQRAMMIGAMVTEASGAVIGADYSDLGRHNAIPSLLTMFSRDLKEWGEFSTEDYHVSNSVAAELTQSLGNLGLGIGAYSLISLAANKTGASALVPSGVASAGLKGLGAVGAVVYSYNTFKSMDVVNVRNNEILGNGVSTIGASAIAGQMIIPVPIVGAGIGAGVGFLVDVGGTVRSLYILDEKFANDYQKKGVLESIRRAEQGFIVSKDSKSKYDGTLTQAEKEALADITNMQVYHQIFGGAFSEQEIQDMGFQKILPGMKEGQKSEVIENNWYRLEDLLYRGHRYFSGDQITILKKSNPDLGNKLEQLIKHFKESYEDMYRRSYRVNFEVNNTLSTFGVALGYDNVGTGKIINRDFDVVTESLRQVFKDMTTDEEKNFALKTVLNSFPELEKIWQNEEAAERLINACGNTDPKKYEYTDNNLSRFLREQYEYRKNMPNTVSNSIDEALNKISSM